VFLYDLHEIEGKIRLEEYCASNLSVDKVTRCSELLYFLAEESKNTLDFVKSQGVIYKESIG